MDKQIMGLSGAVTHGGDLMEVANPGDGHQSNGASTGFREEILPSYDFQPIRRAASPPPPPPHVDLDGGRAWGSTDPKSSSSHFRNYGSLGEHESSKIIHERSNTYDVTNMVEIDHIVKKYADILLHTMEGVNSRLSQLEGRSYILETTVDDLKLSIENSSGSTDGKLRQLENILREVQTGMNVIRDKQEIAEAQMQLSKLQVCKGENQPSDNSTTIPSDTPPQPFMPLPQITQQPFMHLPQITQQPFMPLPQQPGLQQPAQHSTALPPLKIPALAAPPVPNAPVPAPPQPNPTPIQFSTPLPQPHVSTISSMPPHEPYLLPPSQPPADAPPQHYQPPPPLTHLPPPQPYAPAPQLTQYSQPPQPPPQPLAPSQPQHSLPHHAEESSPYMQPSQAYPPSIHQPPHLQSGPPPQQIYGSPTGVYEPPASRPASVQPHFPTDYGPPSGSTFSDSYSYGGSPSPYSSAREPSPFISSAPSGGSTYPRLPTAQVLPQTQPTGSSSGGSTGNRVPLDDVVDKVTTMGFPKELVRATVRKLTENGESVDLNIVLDKLMNGSGGQPPKGWFGR